MSLSLIANVTSSNFENEVLKAKEPIALVYFWAGWSGPCKAMNPGIEQIANEMKSQCKVVKIDVDDEETLEVVGNHSVTGVPLLALYRSGSKAKQRAGFMDKSALIQWITTK